MASSLVKGLSTILHFKKVFHEILVRAFSKCKLMRLELGLLLRLNLCPRFKNVQSKDGILIFDILCTIDGLFLVSLIRFVICSLNSNVILKLKL